MKIFALIGFGLLLSSCGTVLDPALLVNASAKSLTGGFQAQRASEQTLISELQRENESLSFLSRGRYSCGDPQLLAGLLKSDPAALVKQDKIDKKFDAGEKFVTAYLKALNDIITENKSDQETIEGLSTIASAAALLGSPVGATASINAAISTMKTLVVFGVNEANVYQMRIIAQQMDPSLQLAIAALKKHYPAFAENERKVFRQWDQCAVEKLVFIRDIPNKGVKGYENYAFFGNNSGTELEAAYVAYLDKRKQLKSTPITDSLFDQVLSENKKLITLDLSVGSLAAMAQRISTLNSDVQAAQKAIQALR
jgi:hypothetical protein